MKKVLLTTSLIAMFTTSAFADGVGPAYMEPTVAEPACEQKFLMFTFKCAEPVNTWNNRTEGGLVTSNTDDNDKPDNDKPDNDKPGKGPKDKGPKGDNSDSNGKGGNKHNRVDFTHGGTEVAEEKKNK